MIKEYFIDDVNWDKVVKSIYNYDVFYLNKYLKAFQFQGAGVPILLEYKNKKDIAINVVFRRDISKSHNFQHILEKNKYFDLSSPYGYGGFIGIITDTNQLIKEWNEYCINHGYISEFVRFNLFSNYKDYFDGKIETQSHNVIRSLEEPLDEIWMDFKHKVRKNVKRANTYNLEIILDNTGEYLEDFLKIYYNTMDRSLAKNEYYFTKQFFDILTSMNKNMIYFHVSYKGKIISTELVIYGAYNCYSYLGGTDKDFFDLRPNDFLKYEIIKWAKQKGLKNFVLGGGYGADDGIFQYKACLAPHGIVSFYTGKKIINNTLYQKFVQLLKETNKNFDETSTFFPLYRS